MVTGDVVFQRVSPVIYWPDGNLDSYLASLKTLRSYVIAHCVRVFLTGHGRPCKDPLHVLDRQIKHRLMRLDSIKHAVREYGPDPLAIEHSVYAQIAPELHDMTLRSIHAQLEYLGYPQQLNS
jgi:glyoxylase-like metal-dependent hydrolase (beta-lactamase superfamily II)